MYFTPLAVPHLSQLVCLPYLLSASQKVKEDFGVHVVPVGAQGTQISVVAEMHFHNGEEEDEATGKGIREKTCANAATGSNTKR